MCCCRKNKLRGQFIGVYYQSQFSLFLCKKKLGIKKYYEIFLNHATLLKIHCGFAIFSHNIIPYESRA